MAPAPASPRGSSRRRAPSGQKPRTPASPWRSARRQSGTTQVAATPATEAATRKRPAAESRAGAAAARLNPAPTKRPRRDGGEHRRHRDKDRERSAIATAAMIAGPIAPTAERDASRNREGDRNRADRAAATATGTTAAAETSVRKRSATRLHHAKPLDPDSPFAKLCGPARISGEAEQGEKLDMTPADRGEDDTSERPGRSSAAGQVVVVRPGGQIAHAGRQPDHRRQDPRQPRVRSISPARPSSPATW